MSKTIRKLNKEESAMTKVARAGKKSVFRAQQQLRERHAFRAVAHQLIAGAEYL